MERNKKLTLQEEVRKEAQGIVQDMADNLVQEDVFVSETLDRALLEKIQAYEKGRTKKVKAEHMAANSSENGEVEFAEELMPNFTGRTNDILENILSKEDKEALRRGREILELEKARGEPLHEVNKEYHKHLNEPEKRVRTLRLPRKRKFVFALVAVMVLVIGMGVTSVGSKSYLKVLWDKIYGGQEMQVANVSDMDSKEIEDGEELAALKKIWEELKVQAVRLRFKPKGMFLEKYEVDKEQGQAVLFYSYKDEVIRYFIYLNAGDSSLTQREADDRLDEFTVQNVEQTITVKEYEVESSNKNRYIAEFEYEGVNYEIKGAMEKSEIIEITKGLNYFSKKP